MLLALLSLPIRSQLQYRASFVMLWLSHFLTAFIDIIGMWVLFDRFHLVQGWTFAEVGLIYGMTHMGFAFAECFARGFDTFSLLVKSGDFDRFLLRPISPLLQIAVQDVQLMRLGRFLQGFLIFTASSYALQFFHPLLLLSILGIAALFYGLLIIQATLSFWTIETLEIMNIATFGSVQCAQYPISIYPPLFRSFFTYLIPIACVNYYPAAILLHHESLPLIFAFFLPLTGFLFLAIACVFFQLGVKNYCSTGN